MTKEHFNDIYRDQAVVDQWLRRGIRFFTAYTPEGIHALDSEFCQRIRDMTTVAQAEALKQEITENPHLHAEIKENLLLNLETYRKELP